MKTPSSLLQLWLLVTAGFLFAEPVFAADTGNLQGKSVVLVHGAFADGSSWAKVIPLLEARGLHVVSVQNPLSSLADDVAATRRAIEQQSGSVILVGHSWGGVVITEAGDDPKVKALVYVAAVAPDQGQSQNDLMKDQPAPAWAPQLIKDSGNFLTLPTSVVLSDFAQDLPPSEARIIAATQGPWAAGCIDEKLKAAAWHTKPSWMVITAQDHMIPPVLQTTAAATIHAKVLRLESSHVAMLSKPKEVADTIISAARSVP